MHSMLIQVSMPTDTSIQSTAWNNYRSLASQAVTFSSQSKNVEVLVENVWLVNMRIDPLPRIFLCNTAHRLGIAFRLLPFADEPQWLPATPNAPTKSHRPEP